MNLLKNATLKAIIPKKYLSIGYKAGHAQVGHAQVGHATPHNT